MNTLIMISHGNMAREALQSARMIVGETENAYAISLTQEEGPEEIHNRLQQIITENRQSPHFFILVDIIGGTPCNAAFRVAANNKNITILSGLSLGMVIEFFISRNKSPDQLKTELIHTAKQGIKDVLSCYDSSTG
ncbi:PTS sugar transporter subunit IIA [Bacillus salipaludis]|uniref:PTS sugar transporter subunit IIA n=1 Tax=Bacillus salipaludis TaxID=2547811 RepID=A0ABW8RJX6_9BACI